MPVSWRCRDPPTRQNCSMKSGKFRSQIPNEPETLPIYVALLAQTGQRDMAIDVIDQACKNPGNGGEDLLMDLVQTSRTAKLGMEQTIYAGHRSEIWRDASAAHSCARWNSLNSGRRRRRTGNT